MTDMFDRASELEMAQREAAIAAVCGRRENGPSQSECNDCGESIPEERRLAVPGATLCVQCQTRLEQRGSR